MTATAFALVAAAIGDKIPRKVVFTVAFLICGAPRFVFLAFEAPVWAVMVIFAVAGIGLAPAFLAAGGVSFTATMAPVLICRTENWGGRGAKQDLPDPAGTADCRDLAVVPTSPAS